MGESDAHMPDRLHPEKKVHELWSRRLNVGLAATFSDHARQQQEGTIERNDRLHRMVAHPLLKHT
jgi:hypothetical protein